MGTRPGTSADPAKRLVRFKSFRLRLCDERNLTDKYFTDALVAAGLLHDDSPQFCQVQVEQIKVEHWTEERTEITITNL